jgi:hypothetical protein
LPEISDFYKAENSTPKMACPAYWNTRRKPINPEHYKIGQPRRSDLKANTKTSPRTPISHHNIATEKDQPRTLPILSVCQ